MEMSEERFSIVKNELGFYFDVNDTEKRWEIGDVELLLYRKTNNEVEDYG